MGGFRGARQGWGSAEGQGEEAVKGKDQGWGDAGMGPGMQRALPSRVYYPRKQQKSGRRGGGVGVELDTVTSGRREEAQSEKKGGAEFP